MAISYNRQKYNILRLILNLDNSATAEDLTFNLKITPGNAWQRLSKMHLQGYLKKNKRGHYKLSVKGVRIFAKLQYLKNIEKVTCRDISFNLRKPVPADIMAEYKRLNGK